MHERRRGRTTTTVIDKVIVVLFCLLGGEQRECPKELKGKEGFSFEDRVSQKVYEHIRAYPVTVLPPRSTLTYPTVSGLKHQFDVILMDGKTFYLIECKKRGIAVIDQVFSFNSKILDYALKDVFTKDFRVKGIFLCTAEINDNIRKYALAYSILPVDPSLPPIQVMIDRTQEEDSLLQELVELKQHIMLPLPDAMKLQQNRHELFHRFMLSYQKWRSRGYE